MPAKDLVSTAILLFGIVIGPIIFFSTILAYGIKIAVASLASYREQQYLRSLPCSRCSYFSNNEFLCCAINPLQALTEDAHRCQDFSLLERRLATNDHSSYLRTALTKEQVKLKSPKLQS